MGALRVLEPRAWAILILLFAAVTLSIASLVLRRRRPASTLRPLPVFEQLRGEVARAAETGRAIHIALGQGGLAGENSLTTVAAWEVIDSLADEAVGHRVPLVISVGDATLVPLAQDALRRAFERRGVPELYNPTWVRYIASSPFAYAGGAATLAADETVTANVMVGAFGAEVTLVADAGSRRDLPLPAGAVSPEALGALYPATEHLAIGEELFASGAAIGSSPGRSAGLVTQDVLRVVLSVAVLAIALLTLVVG